MDAVEELIDVFENLVILSEAQLAALDRDAFGELQNVGDRKAELIQTIPALVRSLRDNGLRIMDPSTYKGAESLVAGLNKLRLVITRFQTHEKYVAMQILNRKNQMGEKMQKLVCKKNATDVYRKRVNKPRILDRAL